MSGRISGKIALLSGCGGAKGLDVAKLLVNEGAIVYVSDLTEERAREVVEQLPQKDRLRYLKIDVREEADWAAAIAMIKNEQGRLDILVFNGRVHSAGLIADITLEEWRKTTSVILDGIFLGAKFCLPLMVASGGGNIVSISSMSALRPTERNPGYSASYAGQLNLIQSIALQYGQHGIRANSIVCGFSANSPLDDTYALAKRTVPLGRPNTPLDTARAVLWLASDESAYTTGGSLMMDGGFTLGLKFN
jgi:3alpha(or 20beta)-hydroxysteroid dehydrogenase